MEQRKRVVIVGGGYAGVNALQTLASSNLCDIVLIDQHPYHYLQTEAYELIANECSMSRVTIDLVALCLSYGEHVTFIKDTVREIDFENQCASGQNSCHPYDYLLLCSGSRTAFHTSTPGLREHSHGVKTLPSALSFKHQFEQRLYARMESEGGWCSEPFNVVIGGGGLSGVEIAAEMAHFIRLFHKDNTLTCDNIHIFLIVPHEGVLEGMESYLIDKATSRLIELGVKIINHSRITSVEEHMLVLNNEKSLCFDFMIFTGGIVASTLTATIESEKNKKSQLIVDEYLRIPNHQGVFAAGDIAELRGSDGKLLPPTAQTSEQSGALAAENILALIKGGEMRRSQMKMEGMMVALGGKYAAISLLGWIRISGLVGYWIKTIIMRGYHYRLHRQCAKAMVHLSQTKAKCHTGI
ncbi:MAG: FAD-dependent oxidoreductase [Sulfuricurvum sp.]|uniref:NAD(P)/FAD-dependent oxidoreductase n=1 Tax=Sulfuricurvum sp. TaxID=2025608 RepID=UPI0025E29114|nr:FAD-dependent oxidoreductase [Sulfuricurvum sp.]MBV5320489.1 FAD-dependent oxidoreductase [Sulfuricurvum sp.]